MRKMKDSGVPWIGEIPEGWEVLRYKYACRILNGFPFKSELFGSEGVPIIRIRDITSGTIETYYSGDYDRTYIVTRGDILIGMDGDFNIRIWDNEDAILNQRCCTIIEKNTFRRKYLYYCLPFNLEIINALAYSTTVKHLSNGDIENSFLPSITPTAQHRIADHLDTQCARIDATIANIRSLIAKLKEYRQSVITEAVTKGLDPDVPMKDSGVSWIGKVPEGWQVCPLKWRVHFVKTGGTPAGAQDIFYADDGFPWFTPSDFGDSLRISESAKKLSDLGIKEVKIFPKNCVLMIGIGATMGKVALSSCDCSANQQINSIVCDDKLFPLFLTLFLKTITDYLFKCGKFTTLPILNQEETKSIIVPVPSFAEQQRIADYLDTQCAKIDTALARQEELLTKLEAYKKSLIYECVTGKREVPASA